MKVRDKRHAALVDMRWKFLANPDGGPNVAPMGWTDEARRRIADLEQALAASQDLDADTAFLDGLAADGAGVDLTWSNLKKAGEGGESGERSAEGIAKLYSSRMYKEYLKEKRIHRIPHYLARVESPKTVP